MAGFKTDISLGSRWVLDFEPNPKLNVIENQRYRNQHKKIFFGFKNFLVYDSNPKPSFFGGKTSVFKPKNVNLRY